MSTKLLFIVEDDESHVELIRRNISDNGSGFNIYHVNSISEAKKTLNHISPDIILADWKLPDGYGIDLLKCEEFSTRQPVIIMTGQGNEKLAVEAIKLGALDYLIKSTEVFNNIDYILNHVLREWELIQTNKTFQTVLSKNELLMSKIFNNAKDIIFVKNSNLEYTSVNKAFLDLYNKSYTQIIGETDKEIHLNKEFREMEIIDRRVLKGETIDQTITLHINGNEKIFNIIKSPLVCGNGKVEGVFGIARDVTEKEKQQAELLKLSKAIEQSPAGIVITNINGKIEYINKRFYEITGADEEKVEETVPNILNEAQEYFKTGTLEQNTDRWFGEINKVKNSGEEYWAMLSIAPVINSNGVIKSYIGVLEDTTEKKKFEKEIIEAKEKAIKSEQLKSEFLAQMSHEIRTPINSILSFSSLLKSEIETEVSEDWSTIFDMMEISGKRIIRTIDLLLNMSELQTGAFETCPKYFNLNNRIIDDVYKENLHEAAKKNISFEIVNNIKDEEIFADEYSTHKIINNLVENAIKFTEKGTVSLTVEKDENNSIIINVKDTGIGISEEYLDKLFTPFSQEEQGYTRRFEGNGLGLAIVKRYCELNNANISFDSKKGEGTTVSVVFPNGGKDKF